MTTNFLTLRSISTGKTGEYPPDLVELFDDFEIIDPDDAPCETCVIPDSPSVLEVEDTESTPLEVEDDFLTLDDEEIDNYYDEKEGEDRGL